MPELPEVETIRGQLEAVLPGRVLTRVRTAEQAMCLGGGVTALAALLRGRTFGAPERRGKFLVLPLSGDVWLTVHLGMTGRLLLPRGPYAAHRHDRFVFSLRQGGARSVLVFRDPRKFGRVEATVGGPAERVARLGPDGWLGGWDADYLANRFRGRVAPVKALLLDQHVVAGIGNIYADESLFEAAILPFRPAGDLSRPELERLAAAIRSTLDRGVRALGCSISDFVHVDGRFGSMQQDLRAYRRQGAICVRCGATMQRAVIAGRGTGYCPQCQK